MNYLRDRNKKNQKILYIVISLVFISILFYFRVGIFSGLSFITNKLTLPIINIGNNISLNFHNFTTYLKSKNLLDKENQKLKEEILILNTTVSNAILLEKENAELKEVLNRKISGGTTILGAILTKPNRSPYDTIIIDIGNKSGVVIGDMVLASGDIPLGRIVDVYDDYSKTLLFSTPGEKTDVVVGDSGVFMQVTGRGGGNFEMVLPRDFELVEGTNVNLPGINSYVLAKVVTIISDPRDSYKKVLLESPVNIQELKFVQVNK